MTNNTKTRKATLLGIHLKKLFMDDKLRNGGEIPTPDESWEDVYDDADSYVEHFSKLFCVQYYR